MRDAERGRPEDLPARGALPERRGAARAGERDVRALAGRELPRGRVGAGGDRDRDRARQQRDPGKADHALGGAAHQPPSAAAACSRAAWPGSTSACGGPAATSTNGRSSPRRLRPRPRPAATSPKGSK